MPWKGFHGQTDVTEEEESTKTTKSPHAAVTQWKGNYELETSEDQFSFLADTIPPKKAMESVWDSRKGVTFNVTHN